MENKTEVVQLTANNDTAHKVLDIMGYKVTVATTVWGDGDITKDYLFDFSSSKDSVAFCGDNSIGACVGLYNEEDGTLVGEFCFGDDGRVEVDIVEGTEILRIGDL